MRKISELETTLIHFLDWNKTRVSFLIQILQALFIVRTVNLTQIAQAFRSSAKEESVYRRIQRFFCGFSFDMSFIVILACKFFTWGEQCVLLLDRTNWKWGKAHINILVLSIPFIIRIKQNSMVEGIRQGYSVPISTLLGKMGRRKAIENYPIVLWGHRLFASVEHRKGAKEPMIVVSNREFASPLKLYRWRWGIESLFECLKTRGFRMEETHMTDPAKIEKLLFILAIAVCWAYKIGGATSSEDTYHSQKAWSKTKEPFSAGSRLNSPCPV